MRYKGVTLVEIVAVIAILGSLLALSFTYMNPVLQLNKIDDARRKADIIQIKSALDTYYNDHNCYPTNLTFGAAWSENGVVYMRKVPQDPGCAGDSSKCYVYKYSGTCPQWNVVFTKLTKAPVTTSCQLVSSCVPSDYASSSWGCVVSGDADCAHLTSSALSSGSDSVAGNPQGGDGGAVATPTPTPTPPIGCSLDFTCSGNPAICNRAPDGTGQYCDASYYNGVVCNGFCP